MAKKKKSWVGWVLVVLLMVGIVLLCGVILCRSLTERDRMAAALQAQTAALQQMQAQDEGASEEAEVLQRQLQRAEQERDELESALKKEKDRLAQYKENLDKE